MKVMTNISKLFIAALIALAFVPPLTSPAPAQQSEVPLVQRPLSDEEKQVVTAVENYFRALTTLKSRFIQVSSTGYVARGNLYLSRPGLMRFEYDPPSPILITADGTWLTYQDNELEHTDRFPLDRTPVGLLVSDDPKLGEKVLVEEIIRDLNIVQLTLRQKRDPELGTVTLVFQTRPFELKQWVVKDSQNVEVKVALLDPSYGVTLERQLFVPNQFSDPTQDLGN